MFGFPKKNEAKAELPKESAEVKEVKLAPEEINVMPERFFAATKSGLSKRTKMIIISSVAGVIIIAGAIFFSVDWSAKVNQPVNLPPANINNANQNQPVANVNNTNNANVNVGNQNQPVNNSNSNVNNANANINAGGPGEEVNANTNANTNQQPAKLTPSQDSDKDGLTDAEEALYGTNPNKPDTDADGFIDGQELKGGWDPLTPGARLDKSNIVKNYTSASYKYGILYPALWKAQSIDDKGSQMMFKPAGDSQEYIEVIVIEGVTSLPKWYKDFVTQNTVEPSVSVVNGLQEITSDDGLTVYISQLGLSKVFIVNYNIGDVKELNYQSTFAMMVNSFSLTK